MQIEDMLTQVLRTKDARTLRECLLEHRDAVDDIVAGGNQASYIAVSTLVAERLVAARVATEDALSIQELFDRMPRDGQSKCLDVAVWVVVENKDAIKSGRLRWFFEKSHEDRWSWLDSVLVHGGTFLDLLLIHYPKATECLLTYNIDSHD